MTHFISICWQTDLNLNSVISCLLTPWLLKFRSFQVQKKPHSWSYNLPIFVCESYSTTWEPRRRAAKSHIEMNAETNALRLLSCASRWWWPTLYLMRCRNYSVQKSKLWMSVWSWPRPSGASTTESPWPICSATSLWMTEATHTYMYIPAHTK